MYSSTDNMKGVQKVRIVELHSCGHNAYYILS